MSSLTENEISAVRELILSEMPNEGWEKLPESSLATGWSKENPIEIVTVRAHTKGSISVVCTIKERKETAIYIFLKDGTRRQYPTTLSEGSKIILEGVLTEKEAIEIIQSLLQKRNKVG